jgi:hypothetical protein
MTIPRMATDPPHLYAIHVKEHVRPHWSEWFAGWKITPLENGETVLSGHVADQAALHGVLARIRDLNLTLIAVNPGEPTDQVGDPRAERG